MFFSDPKIVKFLGIIFRFVILVVLYFQRENQQKPLVQKKLDVFRKISSFA